MLPLILGVAPRTRAWAASSEQGLPAVHAPPCPPGATDSTRAGAALAVAAPAVAAVTPPIRAAAAAIIAPIRARRNLRWCMVISLGFFGRDGEGLKGPERLALGGA